MADRFPDFPKAVDPRETHNDYFFDRLIACVKYGQDPGELWLPHAVAIDSNTNQIYVADGAYSTQINPYYIARVSIFSDTGEFLTSFSHPDMMHPYGIAICRDNVYVTDTVEHSVFHFKMEADFPLARMLGSKGSGIEQFNYPENLTVSTDGDVFVADRNNNRVQILDGYLHYQRHISHHSMTHPSDIKLTTDEVFVLCPTSPFIIVFSYTGDLIRSLITRGHSIGVRVSPSFLCLDADGNLLLSDEMDYQIKIFSKEGILLHTLGKYGQGAGRFHCPQGIALINNLKLVIVSRSSNCSLQIFSSSSC